MTQKKAEKEKTRSYFILGEEREYVIENLAILMTSGMGILTALESIKEEIKSPGLKKALTEIIDEVKSGSSLSKALYRNRLFPEHFISLIQVSEETGRLPDTLRVIAINQKKDRDFRSKVQSAMLYPVFIFIVLLLLIVFIMWFIMPRLTQVFSSMDFQLPLITKILLNISTYIQQNGMIVLPLFAGGLFILLYIIFWFPFTKIIGQYLLFHTPGVNRVIVESELARSGYIMGNLLGAGLPLSEALDSLAKATTSYAYRKFFTYLKESIDAGLSLKKSFENFKGANKLFPRTIQQIIIAGEQSGSLANSFKQIGEIYEEKSEITTKNLAVLVEPVLLVIVWLGVVLMALAVILPIYKMIGNFNLGI